MSCWLRCVFVLPPSHGLDRLCTADSHSSAPLTAPTPARILVTPCSSGSSRLFGDRHPAPHLLPPSPTGVLTPRSPLPYVLPTHRHGRYLSGWLATSPPQGTEGRQALTQGRDSCCYSFTDTIVSTVVGNAWWSVNGVVYPEGGRQYQEGGLGIAQAA